MFGFSQHNHIRLHWSSLRRCDQPIASVTTLTTTHYAICSLIWIAIFCAVASSFRSDRFHFFANNPDVGSRIATSNPKDAVGWSRGR
jgi:hypothetical protein